MKHARPHRTRCRPSLAARVGCLLLLLVAGCQGTSDETTSAIITALGSVIAALIGALASSRLLEAGFLSFLI